MMSVGGCFIEGEGRESVLLADYSEGYRKTIKPGFSTGSLLTDKVVR